MEQILLISEKYLKAYSTIDLNVDTKMMMSTIAFSQDLYILPLIGSDLYDQLCIQVSGNTLTSNNTTLMEQYLKPCLASFVLYELADFLLFKFTNKSIEKQSSDTSEPITLNELQYLKGKLLVKAQHFGEKMTRFLMAKPTEYPLYSSGNNTYDKYKPYTRNSQSNIYFPNNKSCNWGIR